MLETSYRPEAFWRYLPKSGPLAWIDGGFIHESNGLGGERIADSRAWNRLTLSAGIPLIGQSLVLVPRVWCILTDEGNSDIGRQIGYGELKLAVDSRIGSSRLMGDLRLRKGWSRDLSRGSIQFNLAWQPWPPRHESHFDSSSEREASQITTSSNLQNTKYVEKTVYKRGFPFTLFIQGFSGYCDTMYAYNRKEHHLRAGIGLVFE
jgi:outer membrane phospholipase A